MAEDFTPPQTSPIVVLFYGSWQVSASSNTSSPKHQTFPFSELRWRGFVPAVNLEWVFCKFLQQHLKSTQLILASLLTDKLDQRFECVSWLTGCKRSASPPHTFLFLPSAVCFWVWIITALLTAMGWSIGCVWVPFTFESKWRGLELWL